jgi:hypothetical protein
VPPFITQLNQVFSFYMSKGEGSTGNLKFGGYDLKYAKVNSTDDDIIWSPVIDDGWTIGLSTVKFAGSNESLPIKAEQLTLDTGLSYALVPPSDIEDIVLALKESMNFTCKKDGFGDLDMYACPCSESQYKQLKPLQFKINSKFFTLPVKAWISFDKERENKECKILMHPYDISMTATYKWVVGIQFLQNFYSIFDIQNKRIGLVEATDEMI